MKRFLTIFLFLFVLIVTSSADDNTAIIDKANKEYTKGEYYNAIELYQKIYKNGFESSDLYFNLGNAYFKVNDFASAILYFEKAKKLNPADENTEYNIRITNTKIFDKNDAAPELFLKRWWKSICKSLSADAWAAITIIFFSLFFILVGLYLLSKSIRIRKLSFWAAGVFLVLTIISFTSGSQQYFNITNHNEAIIMSPSVTIKSSPSENSTDLFVVHEGTKVKVIDIVGEWSEVSIANGSRGWMKTTSFEKI